MTKFVEVKQFYRTLNQALEQDISEFGHFNIFKVEDLTLPSSNEPTYSRRNFYKVSLVLGKSIIHYADQSVAVDEGVLVFTNPMIPYLWERLSEQHAGYVCIFTEDFFSRFGNIKEYPIFQSTDKAIIPLDAEGFKAQKAIFDRMSEELKGDYTFKYDLLRTLLMEVIHSAQKMQPTTAVYTGSSASEKIAALFMELLERQFPIELDAQSIQLGTPAAFADQLNVHVNHLNKALKEITGKTTSQLIKERLIEEAKILLKATDWPINRIGWSLGFEESHHFTAYFKKSVGNTPKEYRQVSID